MTRLRSARLRPASSRTLAALVLTPFAAASLAPARAADMPVDVLRGSYAPREAPAALYNWGGFYLGGFGGVSQLRSNHGSQNAALATLASAAIADTPIALAGYLPAAGTVALGRVSDTRGTFGGFVGYNIQWEDTVFGLEADYTRSSVDLVGRQDFASGPIAAGTYNYSGDLSVRSRLALNDYATFRARAGWAIGSVLPFATLGVAVGRADLVNTASVAVNGVDTAVPAGPPVTYSGSRSTARNDRYAYGLAAGAGVDIAILPNLFGRLEYQYVDFDAFSGVPARAHTARAGAAAKF